MTTLPFELKMTNKTRVYVESLEAARDTFVKFIRENGLGSSDLCRNAGEVRVNGKRVASISYNGRMWTPEKWPKCREIPISGHQIKEAE